MLCEIYYIPLQVKCHLWQPFIPYLKLVMNWAYKWLFMSKFFTSIYFPLTLSLVFLLCECCSRSFLVHATITDHGLCVKMASMATQRPNNIIYILSGLSHQIQMPSIYIHIYAWEINEHIVNIDLRINLVLF